MSDADRTLLDDYWTVPEFAAQIKKSARTVARLIKTGLGPQVVYLIDTPLVPKDEGARWLRSQNEPLGRGRGKRADRQNLPCWSDVAGARRRA